jgi:hypothetical protein
MCPAPASLAFEAKKYSEANELCHEDWLRVELGLQKFNGVPLCRADSDLRIRLARPAEMVLYRRAVEADNSSDDSNLVYLIELANYQVKPTKIPLGLLPPIP